MKSEEGNQNFDPYRPLDQGLKYGDAINRWLLLRPRKRIVSLLRGQRVLDVCCGTGNLTAMLAEADCRVVGVDSSMTMLSHARAKHMAAEFLHMDASRLPFQHEFDAAVISIALHEMPPQVREDVWEAMHRAVIPGGRLVALDFAIPRRYTFMARIASGMIERDERGMLDVYPDHYKNYQEFIRNGGLLGWIQSRGELPEAEYPYFGGAVAVLVIR
jgi:demethylmenaquinone methyltransferase/2-methoxy-6-polyprenyl-1,4-benzoquinol methylase